MKWFLSRLWEDFSRYPISNVSGLLLVVMAFTTVNHDRMDYLILAQLMFMSPYVMTKEKE